MAQNKTKPSKASVQRYLASRADEQQYADCLELVRMLRKITRKPPKMWGPSIVGFGSYKYTYESGHSGEAPLTGFAIRGRELVLYMVPRGARQMALVKKLGKHKRGVSCLYFKRLSDLNRRVLERLVANSVADVKRRYG